MRTFYYRTKGLRYKKGIFISFESIFILLLIACLILSMFIHTETSFIIVSILIALIFGLVHKSRVKDLNTGDNFNYHSYLKNKVPKRLNKTKIKDIQIIGDYEFNSILQNMDNYIEHYKNCTKELNRIKEQESNLDMATYTHLQNKLSFKIHTLEFISMKMKE